MLHTLAVFFVLCRTYVRSFRVIGPDADEAKSRKEISNN